MNNKMILTEDAQEVLSEIIDESNPGGKGSFQLTAAASECIDEIINEDQPKQAKFKIGDVVEHIYYNIHMPVNEVFEIIKATPGAQYPQHTGIGLCRDFDPEYINYWPIVVWREDEETEMGPIEVAMLVGGSYPLFEGTAEGLGKWYTDHPEWGSMDETGLDLYMDGEIAWLKERGENMLVTSIPETLNGTVISPEPFNLK